MAKDRTFTRRSFMVSLIWGERNGAARAVDAVQWAIPLLVGVLNGVFDPGTAWVIPWWAWLIVAVFVLLGVVVARVFERAFQLEQRIKQRLSVDHSVYSGFWQADELWMQSFLQIRNDSDAETVERVEVVILRVKLSEQRSVIFHKRAEFQSGHTAATLNPGAFDQVLVAETTTGDGKEGNQKLRVLGGEIDLEYGVPVGIEIQISAKNVKARRYQIDIVAPKHDGNVIARRSVQISHPKELE